MTGFPQERSMLWVRGLIFTVLVPGVIAWYAPSLMLRGRAAVGGLANLGWIPIAAGAAIYFLCLLRFLLAGGTPAVFFTRPLRALIGEEPAKVVSSGLYRYSRNPMYVGVLLVIFGQAVLYGSIAVAEYGFATFVAFHLVVVGLEEPHLRATRGREYEVYCGQVRRWIGRRA